jgi:hypothetical protein
LLAPECKSALAVVWEWLAAGLEEKSSFGSSMQLKNFSVDGVIPDLHG